MVQLKIWFVCVFSVPSDRGDADHGSLESSRGDELNCGGIKPLGSVIVEISGKTCFGAVEKMLCWRFLGTQ